MTFLTHYLAISFGVYICASVLHWRTFNKADTGNIIWGIMGCLIWPIMLSLLWFNRDKWNCDTQAE